MFLFHFILFDLSFLRSVLLFVYSVEQCAMKMWSHKCEKLFYSCHVPVSQNSMAYTICWCDNFTSPFLCCHSSFFLSNFMMALQAALSISTISLTQYIAHADCILFRLSLSLSFTCTYAHVVYAAIIE